MKGSSARTWLIAAAVAALIGGLMVGRLSGGLGGGGALAAVADARGMTAAEAEGAPWSPVKR